MDPKLATLLLVLFALGGECRIHGGEERVPDLIQSVKTSPQKRMVAYKKGDHLFNNIAKALTDTIRDVFRLTYLNNFCKAYPAQNELLVEDTLANNIDVRDHFPTLVNNYKGYKTDQLLTKARDSLSVYGRKHEGPDENALQWSNTIEDLKNRVYNIINKGIEMSWIMPKKKKNSKMQKEKETKEEQRQRQQEISKKQNVLRGLLQNLQDRIDQIINGREYVDQDARTAFVKDKKNSNSLDLMNTVENHIRQTLLSLPNRVRQWAIEAANFYVKKL